MNSLLSNFKLKEHRIPIRQSPQPYLVAITEAEADWLPRPPINPVKYSQETIGGSQIELGGPIRLTSQDQNTITKESGPSAVIAWPNNTPADLTCWEAVRFVRNLHKDPKAVIALAA